MWRHEWSPGCRPCRKFGHASGLRHWAVHSKTKCHPFKIHQFLLLEPESCPLTNKKKCERTYFERVSFIFFAFFMVQPWLHSTESHSGWLSSFRYATNFSLDFFKCAMKYFPFSTLSLCIPPQVSFHSLPLGNYVGRKTSNAQLWPRHGSCVRRRRVNY